MQIKPILIRIGRAVAPLLFYGALLWGAALLIGNPLRMPLPSAVLAAFLELVGEAVFWSSVAMSLLRVFWGLALGIFLGTLLGLLVHFFPLLSVLVRPFLSVVRSTPVAAVIMLVWSFTGADVLPVAIATLMVMPIVADQLLVGLQGADPRLAEMTSVFGFSRMRAFLTYRLPAARPYFFAAMMTSVGFAWKAGIAAEVLAATELSVGKGIYFSKLYISEINTLWAWTLTSVIVSLILEFIVKKTLRLIERRGI